MAQTSRDCSGALAPVAEGCHSRQVLPLRIRGSFNAYVEEAFVQLAEHGRVGPFDIGS